MIAFAMLFAWTLCLAGPTKGKKPWRQWHFSLSEALPHWFAVAVYEDPAGHSLCIWWFQSDKCMRVRI